jgi:peptide deformylase|tara:strand:+ start:1218 stop:1790 length:573 start_codon:yes stop_codon:yes gene_type:complete
MEEMTLTDTAPTSLDQLELIPFYDDMLKRNPKPFDFDKDNAKELKARLIKKMYDLGGVGLSANQVGIDVACFVIGDGQEDGLEKAFFNPEIVGAGEEKESMKEGCLSFPGLWLMVSRPTQVAIKYWDEEGEEFVETYQGVTARVILHEYDHMIGQNFTMRVTKLKLDRAMKALDKKVKKYQRQQSGLQQA